jgi:hypothetical protein
MDEMGFRGNSDIAAKTGLFPLYQQRPLVHFISRARHTLWGSPPSRKTGGHLRLLSAALITAWHRPTGERRSQPLSCSGRRGRGPDPSDHRRRVAVRFWGRREPCPPAWSELLRLEVPPLRLDHRRRMPHCAPQGTAPVSPRFRSRKASRKLCFSARKKRVPKNACPRLRLGRGGASRCSVSPCRAFTYA